MILDIFLFDIYPCLISEILVHSLSFFTPPTTYSSPFAYFLKTNMPGLVCFVHFMDIITSRIVFWKKVQSINVRSNLIQCRNLNTHASHLCLDICSL